MVVVPMSSLKRVFGVGRLAPGPRNEISRHLGRLGLGHLPIEIPDDQEKLVRLYSLDKTLGRLIDRLVHPQAGDEDELIIQLGGDTSYVEKLDRIKAILCDEM